MIAMSQLNAHLLRRSTPERLLFKSQPFCLAFAAVMAFDAATGFGGMWGVLIPLFCVFGTLGFVQPNTMAAALNQDAHRAGSVSALLGGAQFAMGALVSAGISACHDNSPRPLASAILISMIASGLALRAAAKRARRPTARSAVRRS